MGTQDELTRLVGAQDHVTLSVGQDGDRLVEALKGTASVTQVTSEDGQVRFLCEDANVVLPQVFQLAAQADVRVRSVEIQEPNLEAVFLHLTGRALRD
jgi:ABC-2 type transport system ATP-binding protein